MLGVLLRAVYNHNILIIQLLLSGGSTKGIGYGEGGVYILLMEDIMCGPKFPPSLPKRLRVWGLGFRDP